MSFDNTKSSISYLEQRGGITSYDVFNLFHNLCDEAEAIEQTRLEKMPCRGTPEDDLVATLLWCSKKIVRVISKNKESICDSYYIDTINNQIAKLNESIEALESNIKLTETKAAEKQKLMEAEASKKQQLAETETAKKQQLLEAEKTAAELLKEREQKLQAVKLQLDEKIREKQELASVCDRLQTSIDSCQSVDLPALRKKKEELLEKEKELNAEKEKISSDIAGIKTNILLEEKNRDNLNSDKSLQDLRLQGVKQDCDKLNQEITDVKKQIADLEADIKDKQAEYQIEKADLDQLGGKQKELIDMIRKLREDRMELNVDVLAVRKEKEQMEYERKKREYEAAQKKLDDEREAHRVEYETLKADLEAQKQNDLKAVEKQKAAIEQKKADDQAEIQTQLNAVKAKEAEAVKELEVQKAGIAAAEKAALEEIRTQQTAVQNRIQEKDHKIAEEKEKQKDLEQKLIAQSAALTQEQQATEKKICEANTQIDSLKERQQTLNSELIEASREQKKLEDWFKGSIATTNYSSLAELKGQITVLKSAKQNLDREFEKRYIMDGDHANDTLEAYREYFENTLTQVEQELKEYSEKYTIVLKAIGKEGDQ